MGDCRRAGFIRSGKLIGVCDDTKADEFVISCYKDNKKISYERTIEESGFGRKPEMTEIYKIPEFIIKAGEEGLTFQNLYMASSFGRNFGCDLILSATMFRHMDYSILNRKKEMSILEITYDRDIYYTQLIQNQRRTDFIEKIFSFSSEKTEIANG